MVTEVKLIKPTNTEVSRMVTKKEKLININFILILTFWRRIFF